MTQVHFFAKQKLELLVHIDREMIQMKTIKIFSTGKRIQFLFATLRLETHANCSFDYLEVYDGDAIGKRDALKN